MIFASSRFRRLAPNPGVPVRLDGKSAVNAGLRRLATLTAGLPSSSLALMKLRQILYQLFTRRRLDADSDRHPQWVMGGCERAAYRGGWKPAEPPEGADTPWTRLAELRRWCSRD
jgi:hypothetical protein